MLLAVLATVAVSLGALLGRSGSPESVDTSVAAPAAEASPTKETLTVHVSGLVVAPGVVDVAAGSIVADAIAAAGGLRTDADIDALNLAAPVGQGDHIVVPGPSGSTGEGEGTMVSSGGESAVVSLNRATVADLETLPGVGPVLAERIVAWRDENGPFEQVEDLLEVSGIGEAKLSAMRDLVRP